MGELDDLAKSWLAVQCQMIAGAKRAVVGLVAPGQDAFVPAATWPSTETAGAALASVAQAATSKQNPVIHSLGQVGGLLAYPIVANERLLGVVAIEMPQASEAQQQTAMRLLQWGGVWFQVLLKERKLATRERLATVLELLASCLEHPSREAAATALATELATRLQCDRVSVGQRRGRRIQLHAISHSARFDRRGATAQLIEAAMEEAFDQQASVIFPTPERRIQVAYAHEKLANAEGIQANCSVPMSDRGEIVGVITLERNDGPEFSAGDVQLCERTADMVGPLLELKRRADRSVLGRAWDGLRFAGERSPQRAHWGLKLGLALTATLVLAVSQIDGDFRVNARASLVGETQRVIAAPQDGYIAEAAVRAGDVIRSGDILTVFDDRDLRLERLKYASQREQLVKEQRGAFAKHDRTDIAVLGAQIEQANAQLQLLDSQLERIRIHAPLDGVVVSGDLSQKLGSPVGKGEVLFEIAPLDRYRVILNVDERDVSYVAQGQVGNLALSALPGQIIPFTVTKLTPVSASLEGANVFRVEAELHQSSESLRPGMEGVGKIDIERRPLLWIWTRRLTDRVQLWFWSWSP